MQDIFLAFNLKYDTESRIKELINWLVKFDLDFSCFYISEPDTTGIFIFIFFYNSVNRFTIIAFVKGHKYGPDGQVRKLKNNF